MSNTASIPAAIPRARCSETTHTERCQSATPGETAPRSFGGRGRGCAAVRLALSPSRVPPRKPPARRRTPAPGCRADPRAPARRSPARCRPRRSCPLRPRPVLPIQGWDESSPAGDGGRSRSRESLAVAAGPPRSSPHAGGASGPCRSECVWASVAVSWVECAVGRIFLRQVHSTSRVSMTTRSTPRGCAHQGEVRVLERQDRRPRHALGRHLSLSADRSRASSLSLGWGTFLNLGSTRRFKGNGERAGSRWRYGLRPVALAS